ncbi:hypothetical protein [Paenibacillus solani]|uniref:hypothetical protein n=1 Tax=Paenibacillus solani TaxID=1705565 RepID=UPI001A93ADD5|nr:hypothetical protein [Paenibacillus solani]
MFNNHDTWLTLGITLDFVVAIPVLLYFLVYRKSNKRFLSVLPFALLGYIALVFIMPNSAQGTLDVVKYILIPLEAAFIGCMIYSVVRNLLRMKRQSIVNTHPFETLRLSLDTTLGHSKMVPVLMHELSVLFYAMFSWRAKPYVRTDSTSFSYHLNSGWLIIVLFASKMLLLEGALVHIIMAQWSHTIAWIISAGNVYLIMVLIAELRAMRLNPILISEKGIVVRYGNQLLSTIDREHIASVDLIKYEKLTNEQLKTSFIPLVTEPNVLIQLKEPIMVTGPYGKRRQVDQIYLFLDQPHDFLQECDRLMVEVTQ